MPDRDYAVYNIDVLRENVNAYASYARGGINDPYGELDDRINKAEMALQELADFIDEH